MPTLERFFRPPSTSFFLFGPRGTGKSTWLRATFPDALWIDLLAPDQLRRYQARPERLRDLVAGNPSRTQIVIDEVQRAPALLSVVHHLIEQDTNLRFALTGSSARKLKRTGVDLLAGPAVLRRLAPFMAAELGTRFDLETSLRQGLLPLVWDAPDPDDVLRAYIALYLQEEVQLEAMVRDLGAFSRFLEAFSFSHGATLNVTEIGRECSVSRKTVAGYLKVLDDLLLTIRVPVFRKRAKRQLTHHPKLYWFDAGVFVSMRDTGPLDRPEEIAGAALEGLVAQHLRAWIDYSTTNAQLGFWRTRAGREVDFVVYGSEGFWAIEVKHSTHVRDKDLNGLRAFAVDYPEATLRLLYRGDEALEIDGIRCLPCHDYLPTIVPGQPLP